MKDYDRDNVRTLGLFAHGGAGKTSLAEAMLFTGGTTNRLGKVDEGSSILDYEPEEKKRRSSTGIGISHIEWKKHWINLVDTPGEPNFYTDARHSLRAMDAGIFVVDAVDGVKVLTDKLWKEAEELGMARMVVISKLDRDRADFNAALDSISSVLGVEPCPLTIPIGQEDQFKGVVDLLRMKALLYETDGSGKFNEQDVPDDLKEEAEALRKKMVEAIAESDDDLLEKYLEEEDLPQKDLTEALAKGVRSGSIIPVLCASGTNNIGTKLILNAIVELLPDPMDRPAIMAKNLKTEEDLEIIPTEDGPLAALVFKTIVDQYRGKLTIFRVFSGKQMADSAAYNATKDFKERFGQMFVLSGENSDGINPARPGDIVAIPKLKETQTGDIFCSETDPYQLMELPMPKPVISFAVLPKTQGDEEKLSTSLAKLIDEDPTLSLRRDSQTNEFIIEGMGQVHVETSLEKMRRKFGVEVELKEPKVPYLETIRKTVKAEGKYRKQSGGRGQFGWCWVEIGPVERGEGFQFINEIKGGAIPTNYIPSVEKGIKDRMEKGVLAGYPVVDVKARLYDGKYHDVDSSDMAFQIAGSLAFKQGSEKAGLVLLEPIMNVEVTVPDEVMGDVTGDLNRRRGRLAGMDSAGGNQVIKATVPMSEMLRYAPDLDSITSGRGVFTMEFSHYEETPPHITEKVVAASKRDEVEEEG